MSMLLLISGLLVPAVAQQGKLPFKPVKDPRKLPETALVETTKGPFEIRFYREIAPVSVQNFVHLAKKDFYNNLTFHRHVPGFVIQGGDPKGDGSGGPGYTLPPEFSEIKHRRGTIGMGRHASPVNPRRVSNGSQFYICLKRSPHLDGLYTVFAEVIEGIDVVERLTVDDRILGVRLPKGKSR